MNPLLYTLYEKWDKATLLIIKSTEGIRGVYTSIKQTFGSTLQCIEESDDSTRDDEHFSGLIINLDTYFAGEPVTFDERFDFSFGTEFQQRVWRYLLTIPYGHTTTYSKIAKDIGNPNATRAVGSANGQNLSPILVPCHRVIRSDGSLGGYGLGLSIKDYLLRLEGCIL